MTQEKMKKIYDIASNFQFEGNLMFAEPWGNGHINDTYLLTYEIGKMGYIRVILQKMNKKVFPRPVELMENIVNITVFLHKKIEERGGNPYRETLNVIPTKDGMPYYVDAEGEYWRSFVYITDATCYEVVEHAEDFYQSGLAFGHFQCLLADFPAEKLHETIENFHNTKVRMETFKKAVEEANQ